MKYPHHRFFDTIGDKGSISVEDDAIRRHYDLCRNQTGGQVRVEQLLNLLEYLERRVGCVSIVLYLPYLHHTLCHVNSFRLSKKSSSDHETFVP